MKIKRYFAPDIRQAIRLVRSEQGPDAVILSNRSVEGGIEIVAATDYDETIFNEMSTGKAEAEGKEAPKPRFAYEAPEAGAQNRKTAARKEAAGRQETRNKNKIEWQDPALVEMKQELRNLRAMLENQMSNFEWADLLRKNPAKAQLARNLFKLGLSESVCWDIVKGVSDTTNFELIWQEALKRLAAQIPLENDDILTNGGIVAMVGPTGVGKTTTIAKLAARYAMRHGARHVAMVSTDNYRVGAHDQVRTYARILDIPLKFAGDSLELAKVIEDFSDKDLILIDTAGMSQRDIRLSEQFGILNGGGKKIKSYLVLSTTTHLSGLDEVIKAFGQIGVRGCVLTKLDETTNIGSVISATIQNGIPIAYTSDGQRVPEDIRLARADYLINHAVRIMKTNNDEQLNENVKSMMIGRASADAYI